MKTTDLEFELFKKYFNIWIEKFGLKNWQFVFEIGDVSNGMISEAEWVYSNKLAIIILNKEHQISFNDDVLDRVAFHEISHVLLSGYQYLMENNLTKEEFRDPVDHDVIRTLENLIFSNKKSRHIP